MYLQILKIDHMDSSYKTMIPTMMTAPQDIPNTMMPLKPSTFRLHMKCM
jgi:hypothetical protein